MKNIFKYKHHTDTQEFKTMFQRASPELRDCHGGDGRAAGIHAVQAAQEINSGGHCHGLGMLSYDIYNALQCTATYGMENEGCLVFCKCLTG